MARKISPPQLAASSFGFTASVSKKAPGCEPGTLGESSCEHLEGELSRSLDLISMTASSTLGRWHDPSTTPTKKLHGLPAWFARRCTETKKTPGVPGLELTKHLEGEL
jgi:hypothetical protein